MRKNKFGYIFFIFSLSLFFFHSISHNSTANPLPIDTASLGVIVPKDDTSCSMTNASVIVDIDTTDLMNIINFSFSGNYTIFNSGETENITIAAPFSRMNIELDSTCNVKLNDSIISFEIIESSQLAWDLLDDYQVYMYDAMFLICNITIPKNSSVILEYEFNANLITNLNNLHELTIYYYVGTSRAWEGGITESVEFKVHGKIPDEFYNNSYSSCIVTELPDGNSYLWEWNNEIIYDSDVYIVYYGNYSYNPFIIYIPFSIVIIIFISLFIGTYVLYRIAKKRTLD
ncbi:MAG: hypothetical protein ACXAEX_07830 [Promethearchaeota archaeon]|jgi:hypothetical protein